VNHCLRGHALTEDNSYEWGGKRRCRKCRLDWEHTSPKSEARYRRFRRSPKRKEYMRIYGDGLRRRQGTPQAAHTQIREAPKHFSERPLLPAEPFAQWLRDNIPPKGERRSWAEAHGIDSAQLSKIIGGHAKSVHIDTVDFALTQADQTYMLNELYPVDDLERVA
jgi:hypothetical protein